MALNLTTGQAGVKPATAPVTVDKGRIRKIHIDMGRPKANPPEISVYVQWALGYEENGVFRPTSGHNHVYDDLGIIMPVLQQQVTPGNTISQEVEAAIWAQLIADGLVPDGTQEV